VTCRIVADGAPRHDPLRLRLKLIYLMWRLAAFTDLMASAIAKRRGAGRALGLPNDLGRVSGSGRRAPPCQRRRGTAGGT
jgi:hypothetical protein